MESNNLDSIVFSCPPPPSIVFDFRIKKIPIHSYDIRVHNLYYIKDGKTVYVQDLTRMPITHSFYLDAYVSRDLGSRSFYNNIKDFYLSYYDSNDIDTLSLTTQGLGMTGNCVYNYSLAFNGVTATRDSSAGGIISAMFIFDK